MAEESHILELVLTFRIEEVLAATERGGQGTDRTFYLSIHENDAPETLVQRLRLRGFSIAVGSAAPREHDGHVRSTSLNVGPVKWISADLVHVGAESYSGPLGYTCGHAVVVKRHGKWVVVRHEIVVLS